MQSSLPCISNKPTKTFKAKATVKRGIDAKDVDHVCNFESDSDSESKLKPAMTIASTTEQPNYFGERVCSRTERRREHECIDPYHVRNELRRERNKRQHRRDMHRHRNRDVRNDNCVDYTEHHDHH